MCGERETKKQERVKKKKAGLLVCNSLQRAIVIKAKVTGVDDVVSSSLFGEFV